MSTPTAAPEQTASPLAGATDALVDMALAAARDGVPAEVVHHTRRLFVDYVGGVIPSSQTATAQAVAQHVAQSYGAGDSSATAIGLGQVSAPGAALLNGTSAHGLEVDDGYTPGSVHPSSVAFPAVLAAAEADGADVPTTITALAVALETVCRLAAAGHPATWRNHFHNTPLTGVLGGALGVAVLRGANRDQMHDALGIAASHAGGLFAFLGTSAEVKRVHPGKAARDAVASVDLAMAGVTGPRSILETPHGYVDAFAQDGFDVDTLVSGLGEEWVVLRSYVKPYPSCRHLHGPIDAVRILKDRQQIDPAQVDSVEVATYGVAAKHDAREIGSLLDAQMSIPFAVATSLVHDEVGLSEFGQTVRDQEAIRELTRKVTVRADESADATYPRERPATVRLTMTDGSVLEERVPVPYGEPDNPVTDEELTAKFVRLAEPYIGEDAARRAAADLWEFSSLSVLRDIDELVRKGQR